MNDLELIFGSAFIVFVFSMAALLYMAHRLELKEDEEIE